MLNSHTLLLLNRCLQALIKHGEDELASALADVVEADIKARAALSDAAKARAAAGNAQRGGRKPSVRYAIELDPGWRAQVVGLAAAHAKLAEALTEVGALELLPAQPSLAVVVSRGGGWHRLVETDHGTVAVSLTKLGTKDA